MAEHFTAPTRAQRLLALPLWWFWCAVCRAIPVGWWTRQPHDSWRARAFIAANATRWGWGERWEGRL